MSVPGQSLPKRAPPCHVRLAPVSDRIADIARGPFRADSVEKVFLGRRPKFSGTTDAFRVRRFEGPHGFTKKRPRTFVAPLQSLAAARASKNQLSRDFRSSPIFDFCNSICQQQTHAPRQISPYRSACRCGRARLIRLIPLSESPRSSASHFLIPGSERSTPIL